MLQGFSAPLDLFRSRPGIGQGLPVSRKPIDQHDIGQIRNGRRPDYCQNIRVKNFGMKSYERQQQNDWPANHKAFKHASEFSDIVELAVSQQWIIPEQIWDQTNYFASAPDCRHTNNWQIQAEEDGGIT